MGERGEYGYSYGYDDDDDDDDLMGATQPPVWAEEEEEEEEETLQTIDHVTLHIRYMSSSEVVDTFNLVPGSNTVGRRKKTRPSDVRIPDQSVSSEHCKITVGLNAVSVEHLSTNPHAATIINTATRAHRLQPGVSFVFGGVLAPEEGAGYYRTQSFDIGTTTCCITYQQLGAGGGVAAAAAAPAVVQPRQEDTGAAPPPVGQVAAAPAQEGGVDGSSAPDVTEGAAETQPLSHQVSLGHTVPMGSGSEQQSQGPAASVNSTAVPAAPVTAAVAAKPTPAPDGGGQNVAANDVEEAAAAPHSPQPDDVVQSSQPDAEAEQEPELDPEQQQQQQQQQEEQQQEEQQQEEEGEDHSPQPDDIVQSSQPDAEAEQEPELDPEQQQQQQWEQEEEEEEEATMALDEADEAGTQMFEEYGEERVTDALPARNAGEEEGGASETGRVNQQPTPTPTRTPAPTPQQLQNSDEDADDVATQQVDDDAYGTCPGRVSQMESAPDAAMAGSPMALQATSTGCRTPQSAAVTAQTQGLDSQEQMLVVPNSDDDDDDNDTGVHVPPSPARYLPGQLSEAQSVHSASPLSAVSLRSEDDEETLAFDSDPEDCRSLAVELPSQVAVDAGSVPPPQHNSTRGLAVSSSQRMEFRRQHAPASVDDAQPATNKSSADGDDGTSEALRIAAGSAPALGMDDDTQPNDPVTTQQFPGEECSDVYCDGDDRHTTQADDFVTTQSFPGEACSDVYHEDGRDAQGSLVRVQPKDNDTTGQVGEEADEEEVSDEDAGVDATDESTAHTEHAPAEELVSAVASPHSAETQGMDDDDDDDDDAAVVVAAAAVEEEEHRQEDMTPTAAAAAAAAAAAEDPVSAVASPHSAETQGMDDDDGDDDDAA
eukprot:COSAG01_NODE_7045_length_3377_cov_15.823673_1_plen_879_part_10